LAGAELQWGYDRSGSGIDRSSSKLLYYNKTAVNGDENLAESILEKVKNSGLIELAEMAGGIQQFARARFASEEDLRSSAAEKDEKGNFKYLKADRDIFWQDKLIEVKNFFVQDPLALATIYKFFPGLFNLFTTALAATADYGYSEEDALNNQQQIITELFRSFGTDKDGKAVFKPAWAIDNFTTGMKIESAIKKIGWPTGAPPAPPDIFHLRIGAANFYVPPLSISVNTGYKTGSLTGGAIRQKSSPKFNSGYKETTISLKLFFPNYEEIWGISAADAAKMNLRSNINIDFLDDKNQQRIDKFLSSLRGLIAAFKYAPILPIKNHYINQVFGLSGVVLSSMSVSTVPGFPFTVSVDLELKAFNHKPFLPMIKDFNQAVDWSKFRFYMGRAAMAISETAGEEFLLTAPEMEALPDPSSSRVVSPTYVQDPNVTNVDVTLSDLTISTNVSKDWTNGNNIVFYIPSQVQSKIFSPDTSSFRQNEETNLTDLSRGFWETWLGRMGIDITEAALYRKLDTVVTLERDNTFTETDKKQVGQIVTTILAGINSSNIGDKLYAALAQKYISENSVPTSPVFDDIKNNPAVVDYIRNPKSPNNLEFPGGANEKIKDAKWEIYNLSRNPKGYLNAKILEQTRAEGKKAKPKITDETSKEFLTLKGKVERRYADAFNVTLYERIFSDEGIRDIFEAEAAKKGGSFTIKEWEVPMTRVALDPKSVIVNSVAVTMSNNMAKLQLQMQDEPTYQYIGSNDSYVAISMTVFGEKELGKITKMLEFLSGLARLEQAAGVIGFMGIKNVLSSLCGIKYVLPMNYNVDTIPGFPHVYNVQMTFVDFDIFQQKRESISSESQRALINEFGTKRNPFLRLKQNWSMINAYPDMPLAIKDPETNKHVGSLDPDFYFRSFEMFDQDVVNSLIEPDQYKLDAVTKENTAELARNVTTGKEEYISIVNQVKEILLSSNGDLEEVKDYLLKDRGLNAHTAMNLFRISIFDTNNESLVEQQGLGSREYIANKYPTLWKDMVENFRDDNEILYDFDEIKFATKYGDIKISELLGGAGKQVESFNRLVQASVQESTTKELPSFDPDDAEHFGILHYIPAADSGSVGKIPAIYQTPDGGYIFGYSNNEDGRFYIAEDNLRRDGRTGKLLGNKTTSITDTSASDKDPQSSHSGVSGAKSLDQYQNCYATAETDKMQSVATAGKEQNVAKHWEKMMMDSQYRDISGRMLRAFPTYMLWLIDDSNFFAGVKLFDNFYGLQSVIDFSVSQSEDILGDTLVLRLSNTYSKLSKPLSTVSSIVSSGQSYNVETRTDLTTGTAEIIDKLIARDLNLKSHMNSSYVTEINNMRLKPGIRIHLRAGYGSNPNSLETVFNGIITEVEHGEIVTLIAQSDAVELSPIINSVNKKGDSGKIDGGADTGLWMSEPRDLMIRLLSMGSSRTREAFAHATRGAVFSENKFGIRHFGSILYEPLTEAEQLKSTQYRQSVTNAFNAVGNNPVTGTMGLAWNSAMNIATGSLPNGINKLTPGSMIPDSIAGGMQSAGGSVRTPVLGAMQTMWANFSTQRDLELFKRNIYPGNGIGVAQFLGGDIDDGWSSLATLDETKLQEEKFGYLDRMSGSNWNNLIQQSDEGNTDASAALEARQNNFASVAAMENYRAPTGGLASLLNGGVLGGANVGAALGGGLLKVLGSRGGKSIFSAMGLTNETDDDMYDEVSFRAQTYMRSIWDMFQLCARLLPNYIVAVRPFEDRSTIFYGKPHWLYTSGVVPISTGFPSEEQAQKDGVNTPNYLKENSELNDILKSINSETNPLGEAAAALQLKESSFSENFATFMNSMSEFSGIFKAGGDGTGLQGKIVDFNDEERLSYYDSAGIVSKIPKLKGRVQVGFHLPFGSSGIYSQIQNDHQQITQLPFRYRYPFFTNRVSGTLASLDFDKIINIEAEDGSFDPSVVRNIVDIGLVERSILTPEGEGGSNDTALITKKSDGTKSLDFTFSFAAKIASTGIEAFMTNTAAFDPSGLNTKNINGKTASLTVMMPLPVVSTSAGDIKITEGGVVLKDEYTGYYELDAAYKDSYIKGDEKQRLDFTEWGMPKDALHEQFYIAMKWPYRAGNPGSVKREAFKKNYQFKDNDLYGSPEDYKKRRVLVYNEKTKQAVVCAPAYFLWGKTDSDDGSGIDAIVSPDAAFFLGLLVNPDNGRVVYPGENLPTYLKNENGNEYFTEDKQYETLGGVEMNLQECRFTFVPDATPLGVVTSFANPARQFASTDSRAAYSSEMLIGFGNFKKIGDTPSSDFLPAVKGQYIYGTNTGTQHTNVRQAEQSFAGLRLKHNYTIADTLSLKTSREMRILSAGGGNYTEQSKPAYFRLVSDANYDALKHDTLVDKRKEDKDSKQWNYFANVYDPTDPTSIQSRGFYDEKFDSDIKVIAGNGRTISEAQEIWDQFRWGYHTYSSVKDIWQQIYNMDPDDEKESSDPLFAVIRGESDSLIKDFAIGSSKEFSTILGADWFQGSGNQDTRQNAVDIAIKEYINSGFTGYDENQKVTFDKDRGLTDAFNGLIYKKVVGIKNLVRQYTKLYLYYDTNVDPNTPARTSVGDAFGDQTNFRDVTEDQVNEYLSKIKTPKQLFLLMVGIFRQKMWSDPYARAWLVLRPDKKRAGETAAKWGMVAGTGTALVAGTAGILFGGPDSDDKWSFRPVDKIWQAYIDFEAEYATNEGAFKKLLQKNAKEGNSASNFITGMKEDITSFWDRNIGPIFNAFQSALGGLLNMFQMSMQQLGHGLSQLENFTQQANILNKAYNDSIYYSMGRPGTLLRAVDNPFTREYGEPVVEVREPFQRMHYLSSFSHILSNGIKENISGVATQVTAVSDGKYPVTVALDKAAPPERQVEKTVETGLFFDNLKGGGVTGILHPIMHPMETFRGIAKSVAGEPDELTAKRVALSHLKESLKDIYGGELLIMGNTDIRPFDLVYLADVYERMYGIFEVEQVVHHFTPQMGFVTSITPNAFVSVNDPARWFASSWIASRFSVQDLRNSSRLMMTAASNNSIMTTSGDVSIENLSQALKTQLTGGIQFTHGHSALIKDIVANQTAEAIPDAKAKMEALIKNNTGKQEGALGAALFSAIGMPILTAAATVTVGVATAGNPIAIGATMGAMSLASDGIWNGWKKIRDNVLDQHGCYIQYLNKNGQAMDAGLSFNQGMVVGRYHSKKLLPGLLGTRSNVRTAEGHMYVRSDDIMKNLGWKEKDIANVVRYISLENAIVHAQILKHSGIGPEKTSLNESFKAIVKVIHVQDGDTFVVQDVLSGFGNTATTYKVRFDGINTSELNKLGMGEARDGTRTAIINENSPAGKAMKYTQEAVKGKIIVLRINPKNASEIITVDGAYEPGSEQNKPENYTVAFKGKSYDANSEDRYMATIFANLGKLEYETAYNSIKDIFIKEINSTFTNDFVETTKQNFKKKIYKDSPIFIYFETLYNAMNVLTDLKEHLVILGQNDPMNNLTEREVKHFNILVNINILNSLYEKASEWPVVSWDEYYSDGSPVTLNWELVTVGLAKIYMDGLMYNQKSVLTGADEAPRLERVGQ
jgi:hypothetical protein